MSAHRPRLILASSSPYRAGLLRQLQLDFEQQAANIDETPRAGETAAELAARLAREKAAAVAAAVGDGWVIGSDQTAALGDRILGKPGDIDRARAQLTACSGQRVMFHTGLSLLDASSGVQHAAVECTEVVFRDLTRAEIDRYLAREPATDCAGSFRVEGLGISLFSAVHSDDPSNLIGLPLIRLCELLRLAGFEIP